MGKLTASILGDRCITNFRPHRVRAWQVAGYAITIVSFLVGASSASFLDNLSPLWDARRQAWHDKVVHSVVVDRNAVVR